MKYVGGSNPQIVFPDLVLSVAYKGII